MLDHPFIGYGLRSHHYRQWDAQRRTPVLEVLADNYLYWRGGPAYYNLGRICERFPLLVHAVGTNIGGFCPLDRDYLSEFKRLIAWLQPGVVSDHLCFTRDRRHSSFDLLPILCNSDTLAAVSRRVRVVQEILEVPLALENPSSYVCYRDAEFSDLEFLELLCQESGARILLDINNLYVSCFNSGLDPCRELQKLSSKHVVQYHVAGHSDCGDYLFDSHDCEVKTEVWELARLAIASFGWRPLVIERDDEVSWDELMSEGRRARLQLNLGQCQ